MIQQQEYDQVVKRMVRYSEFSENLSALKVLIRHSEEVLLTGQLLSGAWTNSFNAQTT